MRFLTVLLIAQSGCASSYWMREELAHTIETRERGRTRLAVPAEREDGKQVWLDFDRVKPTAEQSKGFRRVELSLHPLTLNGIVITAIGVVVVVLGGIWSGVDSSNCRSVTNDLCGTLPLVALVPAGAAHFVVGLGLWLGGAYGREIDPERPGFRRLE